MDAIQALLGAWTTGAHETQHFDTAPVWRWETPSHPRTAWQGQRLEMDQGQAHIEQAIARLNHFADGWVPGEGPQAKSLDTPAQSPEEALAEALERIKAPQAKGLLDSLQSARKEFDAFVRRVSELVSHYAVIETSFDGTVIARTLVSWTGDFKSLWRRGLTPEQIRLHERNVRAALARRALLIRLMGVISTSAAKIALRLATPGAQLLVLPALWQFVRDVIEELRRTEARSVS